ncbi:hypothetical protein, partial [Streptomyces sp. NPDC058473]|uniref:hypothetical protein n=1 Tax=Streptomyces sp. NPDC058473 TaxID=3346517 RepID=UPI003669F1BB
MSQARTPVLPRVHAVGDIRGGRRTLTRGLSVGVTEDVIRLVVPGRKGRPRGPERRQRREMR